MTDWLLPVLVVSEDVGSLEDIIVLGAMVHIASNDAVASHLHTTHSTHTDESQT